MKIGNHSNMVYWRLSLPPKLPFFSSDNFWLHNAKNIIQCFALSVCVYVSAYYIYNYIYIIIYSYIYNYI